MGGDEKAGAPWKDIDVVNRGIWSWYDGRARVELKWAVYPVLRVAWPLLKRGEGRKYLGT